jgi:hypothetical protein
VTVSVQLGTFILPNDHRVYKYFPGKSYKFHDLVAASSIALMDVRDLSDVGSDPAKWTDEKLLPHISADRVERRVEAGAPRPTRIVKSQGDKATLTMLRGLFFTAKQGDMILMPDKGYTTLVQIGMFVDPAGELVTLTAKDGDSRHKYYGRRIKWVGAVEKRKLSDELINLLHSQAAFFDIGRSHYEEAYNKSLDDYVYDNHFVSTFRTSKRVFTSKDNLLSSLWFELIEVLGEAATNDEKLAIDNIYELAVGSDIEEDDRNDLSIFVQSPGWFRLRALTVEPLVAIALFSMASAGVPYEEAKAATVSAQQVRNADQTCMGQVDQSVRDYLDLLGKQRWEQACKLATSAQDKATLKADVKLKRSEPRGKTRK